MVAERVLNVWEAYERSIKGPKVDETEWDFKIVPQTAAKMKKEYDIEFTEEIIPTDKELIDNLFQAGLMMLVEAGIYNIDTNRVIKVTEDEVLEGVKRAPRKLILGEYRDAVEMAQRKGNPSFHPIVQGGPTGAPVSEDVFIPLHQSYAQEAIVDTIVNGVMSTIEGHPAKTGTPWEIKGTIMELRYVREACARAGRPYMAI